MGAPLRQQIVDCPLGVLDQTPPDTAGPVGRLTSLVNAVVTKYLGANNTPGVATGARIKVEQRNGFRPLTSVCRSSVDGSIVTPPWSSPQMLDSLDDQLVSINASIPRVKSASAFTAYTGSRVVTRKLQQQVFHTTSGGIIQAPDSAWLSGVTCSVWVQKSDTFIGFKADNGAWVVPPALLSFSSTMPKVVADGSVFWVFYILPGSASDIFASAYDTNGVKLAGPTDTNCGTGGNTDNNYDVVALTTGALVAAQGSSSHIKFATVTRTGGTVNVANNTDATTSCGGNLAFVTNPVNSLSYVVATNGSAMNGYEITAMAATHTYAFAALPTTNLPPDSIVGWVDGSLNLFVTATFLAPTAGQTVGPRFDPRYRKAITYECTRGGSTSTVKTLNSSLVVSRAFQLDDDWYAYTYYQSGSGITSTPSATPVTWTLGDFMKGAAIQDLDFAPGNFQYGDTVTITHNSLDSIANNGVSQVMYTFNTIPAPVAAMTNNQIWDVYQDGATITISGASNGGNNGTFTITNIYVTGGALLVFCATTTQVPETFGIGVSSSIRPSVTASTVPTNRTSNWVLGGDIFPDSSWVGENLFVTGTSQSANWGANPITDVAIPGGGKYALHINYPVSTVSQPEFIPNPVQPTAKIQLQLADPSTAFEFFLQSLTFTSQDVIGATLSVNNSGVIQNNTVYQIVQITGAHSVIAVPVNGSNNQINKKFASTVKISISFPSQTSNQLQPTWFIQPLAVTTQSTVGRFEYGLAYADWRFDGANDSPTSLYPLDVFSVPATTAGLQVILPYRAESFSAGVTAPTGNPVDTFFSTVGLKAFTLSKQPGQSLTVAGELIIPGPQASEFTSSSFTEQGINLGPEAPFFVSQTNDSAITIGLSPGTQYQYRVVFEYTDEDGERIFTVPSPPLNVYLATTNNTITLGGNVLQQTQRIVTIAIYRTSIAGGQTTVQHYKITNDTDPNGTGFTFPDIVTWNFKDQRPDSEILVSEVLYTDKGFKPRYPCPAFIQGVGTWRNRTWVVGYDGAIWMSGEKTEGDAVWFHPDFRFLLPTDDEPTCIAAMDDYLIILAAASNWYIPAVTFPDATGNNGQLPAPVQLPFANGGTGFAVTTRDGVIYSSTAGGAWLIPRNLTNGWLSQPIQQSLGLDTITGIAVDKNQRVLIAAGGGDAGYVWDTIPGAWYKWVANSALLTIAEWQGNFVYCDTSRIYEYTPGTFADNDGLNDVAIPPSWTLAPIHLMGSVRGYGRCWAIQLQGEYKGPHYMNLTLGYGDESDYQPATVFPPFAALPTKSYLYEWNPKEEEASQFELSFAVTFDSGVAGNSGTWELLSFDVGVDQGIARLPAAKRVSSDT